ncbi:bifunctional hydroxymethylpyrimidine kinase/phosphomethylpyrimidine kinase [Candidatus Zinderia endosymbiont of Aphrophora alni]|uniref:bifunctional hydroxymethylpyrimidine kinase/phosphomethylpyrimidine kinase n=1 Tax=Candidatus Zinderia endosymbiont of Aphrophora alni TaxID=3077951 RepID=UPI0030D1116D
MINNIMSIAGTDPISGAGIQSDIKTFSALKTYGVSVITSIISQNSFEVRKIFPLNPNLVVNQMNAIFDDIYIHAIKIGVLVNDKIIKAISTNLQKKRIKCPIIFDPILFSSNGKCLLKIKYIKSLKENLFPLLTLITPNLFEILFLIKKIKNKILKKEIYLLLREIRDFNIPWVLLKGGHLKGKKCIDFLCNFKKIIKFISKKINNKNIHGTGCTFSSAITALLSKYNNIPISVYLAKKYLNKTLINSNKLNITKKNCIINHFYKFWNNFDLI